jgi:hypothetical protein
VTDNSGARNGRWEVGACPHHTVTNSGEDPACGPALPQWHYPASSTDL